MTKIICKMKNMICPTESEGGGEEVEEELVGGVNPG